MANSNETVGNITQLTNNAFSFDSICKCVKDTNEVMGITGDKKMEAEDKFKGNIENLDPETFNEFVDNISDLGFWDKSKKPVEGATTGYMVSAWIGNDTFYSSRNITKKDCIKLLRRILDRMEETENANQTD